MHVPEPEPEPDELTRFRAEWKAEVNARKNAQTAKTQPEEPAASSPSHSKTWSAPKPVPIQPEEAPRTSLFRTDLSQGLEDALVIYRQAVQHEERGELDQALLLYRQAFRKEPQIDKLYRREQLLATAIGELNHLENANKSIHSPTKPVFRPPRVVSSSTAKLDGQLVDIVSAFPDVLKFEPEDEKEPFPIAHVPDELIVDILCLLDPSTIERFALATRKARVLTLDSKIWRTQVMTTYKTPQVTNDDEVNEVLEKYTFNYRRVFVEHPRIRTDGVYIAVCHYMRNGLGENPWVNMSHLITYHRFLRFLPNGQVLSLLVNEDVPPAHVISILKPSLRMQGFFLGTWSLTGTTIALSNLLDASGRFALPLDTVVEPSPSGTETSRYIFTMSLSLRSRPVVGKWNRLDITSYDSTNLRTGDSAPVALKHERPFWFSKVKSYGVH